MPPETLTILRPLSKEMPHGARKWEAKPRSTLWHSQCRAMAASKRAQPSWGLWRGTLPPELGREQPLTARLAVLAQCPGGLVPDLCTAAQGLLAGGNGSLCLGASRRLICTPALGSLAGACLRCKEAAWAGVQSSG